MCLEESCHFATGDQLRNLFVVILLDGAPSNPQELWDRFCDNLCEQLARRLDREYGMPDATQDQVYDYGLYIIDNLLATRGSSLQDHNISRPDPIDWDTLYNQSNHVLYTERRRWDPLHQTEIAEELEGKLNDGQHRAFQAVYTAVQQRTGECFFLHGPGGTGKTYVYCALAATFRGLGYIVLCVASTGIASILMPGGRTAHTTFRIPLDPDENSTCAFRKHSKEADLIRHARIVIFDEAPPLHRHCIEAIDRSLQDLFGNNKIFGGLTFLFGGDFQQTLPVIVKGTRPDIVNACIQQSYFWKQLTILKLEENMRLRNLHSNMGAENDVAFDNTIVEDQRWFAQWQLDVGHGRSHLTNPDTCNITIPGRFHCPENTIESLIDIIYPNIDQLDTDLLSQDAFFAERSILSARNDDVNTVNASIINRFPGELKTYHSIDTVSDENDSDLLPVEYLNSVNVSGIPLSQLQLKIGAPVMVLRNINPADGVCNGTRGIVTQLRQRVVQIRLLNSDNPNHQVLIPRINLSPTAAQIPFHMNRFQFPLRLAFSMTMNKSQGQSLKHVGLDLRSSVFTHGQFYVAISRATSVDRLKAIWDSQSDVAVTKNIVFPEVFTAMNM